jgi:hypothetical protein
MIPFIFCLVGMFIDAAALPNGMMKSRGSIDRAALLHCI